MGIPRKGSRGIVIDGKPFRYMVRQDGAVVENPDPSKSYEPPVREFILVTVQEDAERPGRVLQWRWPHGASVFHDDVKAAVRLALERGWDPAERGSAFQLGDDP